MKIAALFCRRLSFSLFVFLAAGCADLNHLRDSKTGMIPQDFPETVSLARERKAILQPAVLRQVRTASLAGFDRVVFEFQGNQTPGYDVEYLDPFRESRRVNAGSNDCNVRLEIALSSAQAHSDSGHVTVASRDRVLNFPSLKQLSQTGDFESEVVWILCLNKRTPFRVVELSHPPRIVVDVKQ